MQMNRLRKLLWEGPPLQFYVRLEPDTEWFPARPTSDPNCLKLNQGACLLGDVQEYVVAYPSGEVLDHSTCRYGLPSGLYFCDGPVYKDGSAPYTRRNVRNSNIRIVHASSRMTPTQPEYHSTSITNLTDLHVRVYKFRGLAPGFFGWKDLPHGYYSPLQFCEWYRVPDSDGWIAPGETVCDPDNWTEGRMMWAYFFENERGDRFIATTLVCPVSKRRYE